MAAVDSVGGVAVLIKRAARIALQRHLNLHAWLTEWMKVTVLKTVEGKTSLGSNPKPRAILYLTVATFLIIISVEIG